MSINVGTSLTSDIHNIGKTAFGVLRSSGYKNDIGVKEGVQKAFTRMLTGMKGWNLKERNIRLGLFTLECRKLNDSLKQVYKIM